MFIENLTLINFRKYENLEVEFNNKLTVIAGKNGSGKSAIIDAAAKLLSVLFRSLLGYKTDTIKRTDIRTNNGIEYTPVEIKMNGNISSLNLDYSQYIKFNGNRNSFSFSEPSAIYDEQLMEKNTETILPVICSYGAGRLWNGEGIYDLTKTTSLRKNGYINCINAHLATKDMNTWFEKMTYEELQNEKPDPLLSAVRHAIQECFKKMTGNEDVKVKCNLKVHELEISFSDTKLLMCQLSEGYRCTVCLIADIAYRMATLNPQLEDKVTEETEGIVLIDEVDLHLHPEWQQKILGVLTTVFPKVQFIVTTHAPAVINSVKSESLILLEDDKAYKPDGEVYGKDVNTIITSVMNTTERPEKIKSMFEEFYNLLDDEKFDYAKNKISEIEHEVGNDDPELTSCRVKLKFALM